MAETYIHGQFAINALPDDGRLHVQVYGYFYARTLRHLREDLRGNRDGLAVVELACPINAPTLQIVLDRRSLYLRAFRAVGQSWWGFTHEGCPANLPGGPVRPIRGSSNYARLGLPASIHMTPVQLLTRLAAFGGNIGPGEAEALVLLLFLVPEALRFDDVLMECCRYFSIGTQFAHTIHPVAFRATVTAWAGATPGDPNVLLPHLP